MNIYISADNEEMLPLDSYWVYKRCILSETLHFMCSISKEIDYNLAEIFIDWTCNRQLKYMSFLFVTFVLVSQWHLKK